MAQKDIEASINELKEELKNKVEIVKKKAANTVSDEPAKVEYIRDKTITSLNYVADKIDNLMAKGVKEKEIRAVMETVRGRSNELYKYAMQKMDALKKGEKVPQKKLPNKSIPAAAKAVGVTAAALRDANPKDGVKEKAMRTLKGWLTPESEGV
jgi:hypothetical protein